MRIEYTPSSNSTLEYVNMKQCYLEIGGGVFTQREHYTSREKCEDTGVMIDKYRDYEVKAKLTMFSTLSLSYISSEDRWRIEIYFMGTSWCVWIDFEDRAVAKAFQQKIWPALSGIADI